MQEWVCYGFCYLGVFLIKLIGVFIYDCSRWEKSFFLENQKSPSKDICRVGCLFGNSILSRICFCDNCQCRSQWGCGNRAGEQPVFIQ